MSTPEEITADFADATTAFDTTVGCPEDGDIHRLHQRVSNLLQGVPFCGKSDSLYGIINHRTDYSDQYGHNFDRLESDLPAYNLYINDDAKNIVRVWAEQVWTKKLSNQTLIEADRRGLKHFFLTVIDKTWTNDLEDGKTFSTTVLAEYLGAIEL